VRYQLVDRIEELRRGEWAVGVKCVSLSDDVFEHHFPGQPVYPGALLIESMAQLGGALLEVSLRADGESTPRCVLSAVKARLRDFARPGDRLVLRAEVLSCHTDAALVRVQVACGERRVCDGELTYVMVRVDDPRLEASRRELLDLLTRETIFR
jgi:3-hydroxymyristoyl/3-hydroxydecanoyl-(acyl carrier protein) dehydratase